MSKIVIIGSLTYDISVVAPHIPKKGETLIGSKIVSTPGGKGANQATTCLRLGIPTAIVGAIGDDNFGAIVGETHKQSGLDTSHLQVIPNCSTGFASIFVDINGYNSIVVVPGSNLELSPQNVDETLSLIKNAEVIMTQLEVPLETTYYALKKAKELGKITIFNPAPAQDLDHKIYEVVDYITPNETELEILTGIEVLSVDDAIKGAKILQSYGAKNVIVTLGEQGALLITSEGHTLVPAIKVTAIDTVAAGDCFNGGFATGLVLGKTPLESVHIGVVTAALSVTKEGSLSSLPTIDEVRSFCTTNNINCII